jgi:hypothetical protein
MMTMKWKKNRPTSNCVCFDSLAAVSSSSIVVVVVVVVVVSCCR